MQFDYIIVGAGSAGCVLANRLTENPEIRVLLLEAGGKDSSPNVHIPAAFSKLFLSKDDWKDYTTPQSGMMNRQMYQPRGKVWGGCSSINAMIYIRGHKADYDAWSAEGNKGWSYDEVLPYFKKSENNLRLQDTFHNNEGELYVSDLVSPHDLSKAFVAAGQQAGLAYNEDFNGSEQEGVGFYQVNQFKGKRWSAVDAFLKPARKRKNLVFYDRSYAQKVLFEGKKAIGVAFSNSGEDAKAYASREVILASGAFQSPKILMLSGIGDQVELKAHGIEVLHHLPGVGKNLHDHVVGGIARATHTKATLDSAEAIPYVFKNVFNYLFHKRGPLTSNVAEAGGFVKTLSDLPAPDIQFMFGPLFFLEHGFKRPKGNGYSLGATLIYPKSRGSVTLKDAHPKTALQIDPNYFGEEDDVQTMLRGARVVEKILNQPAFDPYFKEFFLPAKDKPSDQELIDLLRENSETLYHPVGTCKMGSDSMSVVDDCLKVHGIEALRVVDASIMPTIVRGNTNAPTYMIAEKAADLIRGKR